MLSKLVLFCIPSFQGLPVDPSQFPHGCREHYGWFARLVSTVEDQYFRKHSEYAGELIVLTPDTITVRLRTRIPRTFSLAPALTSDRLPLERRPGMGHRLRNVRVGDMVQIDVTIVRDEFVCYSLGIYCRPGGKIPPAEDADLPDHARMHNFYNALQFMEERVFPDLPRLTTRAVQGLLR